MRKCFDAKFEASTSASINAYYHYCRYYYYIHCHCRVITEEYGFVVHIEPASVQMHISCTHIYAEQIIHNWSQLEVCRNMREIIWVVCLCVCVCVSKEYGTIAWFWWLQHSHHRHRQATVVDFRHYWQTFHIAYTSMFTSLYIIIRLNLHMWFSVSSFILRVHFITNRIRLYKFLLRDEATFGEHRIVWLLPRQNIELQIVCVHEIGSNGIIFIYCRSQCACYITAIRCINDIRQTQIKSNQTPYWHFVRSLHPYPFSPFSSGRPPFTIHGIYFFENVSISTNFGNSYIRAYA